VGSAVNGARGMTRCGGGLGVSWCEGDVGRLRGRPASATELMVVLGWQVDSWAMWPGKRMARELGQLGEAGRAGCCAPSGPKERAGPGGGLGQSRILGWLVMCLGQIGFPIF